MLGASPKHERNPMSDDPDFDAELRSLLADGRKINAIKRYREETGAGLTEAKQAVEALERGRSGGPNGTCGFRLGDRDHLAAGSGQEDRGDQALSHTNGHRPEGIQGSRRGHRRRTSHSREGRLPGRRVVLRSDLAACLGLNPTCGNQQGLSANVRCKSAMSRSQSKKASRTVGSKSVPRPAAIMPKHSSSGRGGS